MATQRLTKHNAAMVAAAFDLLKQRSADALLVLLDGSTDWKRISEMAAGCDKPVIVAVDSPDDLEGAAEIQKSLLPPAYSEIGGVRIASAFQPCDELGGDVFNIFNKFKR